MKSFSDILSGEPMPTPEPDPELPKLLAELELLKARSEGDLTSDERRELLEQVSELTWAIARKMAE